MYSLIKDGERMAYVSEKMDENKINFLANEIAKTYMTGKMVSSEVDFINAYMDMYEKSKGIIISREEEKVKATQNISLFDDTDVKTNSYFR